MSVALTSKYKYDLDIKKIKKKKIIINDNLCAKVYRVTRQNLKA